MLKNTITENQLGALLLSLEKGDCPVKYSYLNEKGAQAWNEIEKKRAENGGNYAEYELLRDNIEMYLQEIGNPSEVCFFDFGCGTGKTVEGMLKKVVSMGLKVHYHAFDISEEIALLAKDTIGNLGENYSFDYTILDFETFNLSNTLFEIRKKYENVPVIGMLLGSTIGNFDSMERIVINIMESMRIEDRMIIGVEKFDTGNEKRMGEMITGYKDKSPFNLTFSTLNTLGVKESDGNYQVIFNQRNSSIEGFFDFSQDVEISVGNKKITFSKGDKVRIFKSTKMNEVEFCKLFVDLDYRIAAMRTNSKNTFIEVMIGAKKY